LKPIWEDGECNLMLLEIKDLKVSYGRAEALKGISLGIEEGSGSPLWVPTVRANLRFSKRFPA
jgi:hypothetical protein